MEPRKGRKDICHYMKRNKFSLQPEQNDNTNLSREHCLVFGHRTGIKLSPPFHFLWGKVCGCGGWEVEFVLKFVQILCLITEPQ